MTIDNNIRDKKLQSDINREAAKISALSSGKTDKYEYLTNEGALSPNQSRMIEQAKFTLSPLGKAFEDKATEDQEEKEIKALEEHEKQLLKFNSEKNSLTRLMQEQIFDKLTNERMDEIKS